MRALPAPHKDCREGCPLDLWHPYGVEKFLHNLHVLRGTPLEQIYLNGDFEPLTLEEYARRVALFLEHLNPKIAVHRLAAVASRWNELLAPNWNREKMRPMQFIQDYMLSNEMHQGRLSENLQEEIP